MIPRHFQLINELNAYEKGIGDCSISIGLKDSRNKQMFEWVGTLVLVDNPYREQLFVDVALFVGSSYPCVPPTVQLLTLLDVNIIDSNGFVNTLALPVLEKWSNRNTLYDVMKCLRTVLSRADSWNR
eukprot:TRINITY_DN414_c0_g1_i1.p1 TRINITY_DN414_c0_g1~~TRINITY_DN414_c0_g1_i1.p1  ORF type:complete len:127 (+),score=24.87 TRINITY_DN414_c0_g1_i1:61-441(+)